MEKNKVFEGIEDVLIGDLKWQEIVQLICEKQPSIHLILNKDGISALDLYQRILRHKVVFFYLVFILFSNECF